MTHRHKFPKGPVTPFIGSELSCPCGAKIWRYPDGNQVPIINGAKVRKVSAPGCTMTHLKALKKKRA